MEKFLNGTQNPQLELKRIDIFGYQITLRMNQYSTYRTSFGGLISILVIATMIILFQSSFWSFLNKEQLKAIAITSYNPTVVNATIRESEFLFAVAVEQENFITRPFFNVSLLQVYQQRFLNGSQKIVEKQIMLIQCTESRFQRFFQNQGNDLSESYLNQSSLNNFLCPDEQTNFSLGGTYISEDFSYLTLTISKCLNSSICASDEELQNYLNEKGNFKFQIFHTNYVINPNNPNDNFKQSYLDDSLTYSFIPHSLGRSIDVYLRYYEISKDQSLTPLSDIVIEQVYLVDQLETKVISELGNNEFIRINFKRSPFKTNIKRSYLKFDEMLSNLGGIQQIIFFFVGIFVTLYNKLQSNINVIVVMIELANRVYEFSLDNSEQQRQQQEKLELINFAMERQQQQVKEPGSSVNNSDEDEKPQTVHQTLINQKENNSQNKKVLKTKRLKAIVQYLTAFQPLQNKEQAQQKKESVRMILDQQLLAIQLNCKNGLEYFEKQVQQIISRAKPIGLSCKMLINVISCNKIFSDKAEITLLNKGIGQIAAQMDLYSIIQKMNELTKLKEVVLSYNQLLMFNFTPKPQITLDEQAAQPTRDTLQIKLTLAKDKYEKQQEENIFKRKRDSKDYDDYMFYAKIYNSYDDVLRQSENDIAIKNNNISKQLIEKLGPELQSTFKLSKLIDFQSQNSTQNQVKTPFRRGAMQQKETNVFAKMFDPEK